MQIYYLALDNKIIGDEMEIWKNIKGYENLYLISNTGKVKALAKSIWNGQGYLHFPEIIRKPTYDKDGYLNITLSKKGKSTTFKLHRLVATAFIPNPNNLPEVNHIDGNKSNNKVDNLEWVTRSENQKHAFRTGLINQNGKNNHMYGRIGADNPNSIPIYQLDKYTGVIINEYDSLASAGRALGVNIGKICLVCQGKRNSAYGYKWKYK